MLFFESSTPILGAEEIQYCRLFHRNLISEAFHPLLLGKRTNIAITERQHTRVYELVFSEISAGKGVAPIQYPAGFLSG
jgi:hypothetical protein